MGNKIALASLIVAIIGVIAGIIGYTAKDFIESKTVQESSESAPSPMESLSEASYSSPLSETSTESLPNPDEVSSDNNRLSLYNMTEWQQGGYTGFKYSKTGTVTDNLGEKHIGYYYGPGWTSYRVDGDFNYVCGTIFIRTENNSKTREGLFFIYDENDEELYKKSMTGGDEPITFKIPISKVKILKLELDGFENDPRGVGGNSLILVDDVYLLK